MCPDWRLYFGYSWNPQRIHVEHGRAIAMAAIPFFIRISTFFVGMVKSRKVRRWVLWWSLAFPLSLFRDKLLLSLFLQQKLLMMQPLFLQLQLLLLVFDMR